VSKADTIAKLPKESQVLVLQYGLSFMRYLLRYNQIREEPMLSERENQAIKKLSDLVDIHQINSIITLLNDSLFALERNANAKILYMDFMIHVHRVLRKNQDYHTFQIN